MKIILLIALLVASCNASQKDSEELPGNETLTRFYSRYSNFNRSMTPGQFQDFLTKFLNTYDEHSHEISTDQDHCDDGSANYDSHPVFKIKCFQNKMKSYSEKYQSILPENLRELSLLFVTSLDEYIQEPFVNKTKNGTIIDTIISKKENWFFAFLSSIIITIIGLLCYLVVPSLNALSFNYLFQFLVALAVGTLTGDALLHLIPHAFSEHDHNSGAHHDHGDSHNEGVYKGLGAVVGIYVFFLIERIMQMRRARIEKRHRHDELNEENHNDKHHNDHERVPEDPDSSKMALTNTNLSDSGNKTFTSDQMATTSKQRAENEEPDCLVIHANKDLKYISKYLPNNKCAENIDHHDHANEIQHLHQHNVGHIPSDLLENILSSNTTYDTIISNVFTNSSSSSVLEPYFTNKKQLQMSDTDDTEYTDIKNTLNNITNIHKQLDEESESLLNANTNTNTNKNPCICIEDDVEIKILANSRKHSDGSSHSHVDVGHGHSHSHKYKSSREQAHHNHHMKHEKEISDIKLIAWMVIMGDGLHNFADGLAIGASFALNLPAGFGTSIAVLCHELPHEIGDFAVLRRAGVSLKRALVFNALSGVLCCIGTFVGLIIGGYPALSNWIFLFIAGIFLYISLVDMIPELSEDKEDDSVVNFLIQSFGILAGVGVMLVIALYEDKIKKLLTF